MIESAQRNLNEVKSMPSLDISIFAADWSTLAWVTEVDSSWYGKKVFLCETGVYGMADRANEGEVGEDEWHCRVI